MSTFRLHLWREWREHRTTLLFLALALPLLAGLAALRLPRRFVGDPWMACALIAIFVVVVLAAVGGELLGRERRGPGLRWLERLPGGLGHAFAAKLSLHLSTSVVAGVLGFACAQAFAWLRGRGDYLTSIEFVTTLPLVALLAAWTFACSAWALRGGTAILAAALILGLCGYPVVNVLLEGYRPGSTELLVGTGLGVLAGLGSGAFAFLRGSRRGAGPGPALAFGLVPLLPLVALGGTWSLDRLEQRGRIEPAEGDFALAQVWVTEDGSKAFVAGHHRDPHWGNAMPIHVVRVDLATGAWTSVVRDFESHLLLSSPREDGLMRLSAQVLNARDSEREVVLSLKDGSATARTQDRVQWGPVGLGQWQWRPGSDEGFYYDPFRRRSYPDSQVQIDGQDDDPTVYIRPGRWLIEREGSWSLYDPDTREDERLEVRPGGTLVALLPDGRALFDYMDEELYEHISTLREEGPDQALGEDWDFRKEFVCLDPTTGQRTSLGKHELANLLANEHGLPTPDWWDSTSDRVIVHSAHVDGSDWCVLDPDDLSLRTFPAESGEWYVASLPGMRMLVWIDDSLVELDLTSGARRTVFPPAPES